ncbi:Exopolygalacturonase [Dactylella cylindrospora]|nr:Exopolygalacturonase [Dactylella cylindrospora]
MKLFSTALATLAVVPGILASPATKVHALEARGRTHNGKTTGQRPVVFPYPLNTGKKFKESPKTTKTCFVDALGNGRDDGPNILAAAKKCNNGGKIALLDDLYTVRTALDLKLNKVDIELQGTLRFVDDIPFWEQNSFKYEFQNSSSFIQIGGKDVNIYGGGTIDGNSQKWIDAFAVNNKVWRPVLMAFYDLDGATISHLNFRYSPNWYVLVHTSKNVIFDNISIAGGSSSSNEPKNTDGWDTYRSDNIVIQNSKINNHDDCVSFKPNSTNILVQGLDCNGSHGISVGSLGQYPKYFDIVENVYIFNCTMTDSGNAARIKVWSGEYSIQPGWVEGGGGGHGLVNNVTWDAIRLRNVDNAIEVTQCYGQSNITRCNEVPATLKIQNVLFRGMYGTTSKKNDPRVGSLVCAGEANCNNIYARDINAFPPSAKDPFFICNRMDQSLLDLPCQQK